MQTEKQIDAIRERQDARAIDAKYGDSRFDWDAFIASDNNPVSDRKRALAIELEDVKECLLKGTLDYTAAAGVLIEFLDDLLEMVRK